MSGQTDTNTINNAPYLSADRSELAPLYSNPLEVKGLRGISTFFFVFSLFVVVVLAIQIHYGNHQIVPHGSVVTDSFDCSVIGADAIKKGGNAVDAVVASTFCMGVVNPHLTGLGGGGLMLIYDQRQRRLRDCLDFRVLKSHSSSVGVPGLLAGLYHAHLNHGALPWKQILTPSINLARSGFHVTSSLLSTKFFLKDNTTKLYSWLMPLQKGQQIVNFELADTLEAISNFGPDVLYNGNLTDQLVTLGGLLQNDVTGYQVLRGLSSNLCTEHVYNEYKIVLPFHGSGGPLTIKTMDLLNLTYSSDSPVATVGGALLAGNSSEMAWPLHTGSVVVATDRSDVYVSVVSGLGSMLGSQILLPSGFILNNGLEVASLTSDNRAISLAVPLIVVDTKHVCGRRFISGAADARDAIQLLYSLVSSSSSAVFNTTDVERVVESPRVRFTTSSTRKLVWIENQPRPSSAFAPSPGQSELIALNEEGFSIITAYLPYPSLNIIEKVNDLITSHADSRGDGYFITF